MSVSARGTSFSSASDGGNGLAMLALLGGIGWLAYVLLLAPGFALTVELYAGVVDAPASFTAVQWSATAAAVASGALCGLIVGLLRAVFSRGLVAGLVDALDLPGVVSAGRVFWACALFHVMVGAFSGLIVGLLGLLTPLSMEGTLASFEYAQPAMHILMAAGFLNGGGAGGGGFDTIVALLVILFWIFLLTVLFSALLGPVLTFLANALLGGAAQGLGGGIGGAVVLALRGRLTSDTPAAVGGSVDERGKALVHRLRTGAWAASLVTSIASGALVGLVNGGIVVGCLYVARPDLLQALGPPPRLVALTELELGDEYLSTLRFHPDGTALFAGGVSLFARWSGSDWQPAWRESKHYDLGSGAFLADEFAMSADGTALAILRTSALVIYDAATGRVIATQRLPDAADPVVRRVLISGDQRFLAVAWPEAQIMVYRLRGLGEAGHAEEILVNSQTFAGLPEGSDTGVLILDLHERKGVKLLPAGGTLSPDGRTLAGVDYDKIVLDRLDTRRRVVLSGHDAKITDLSFSPDSRMLASTVNDAASPVRVWEVASGRCLAEVRGAFGPVAFSPDNRLLVNAGGGKIRFWKLESPTP